MLLTMHYLSLLFAEHVKVVAVPGDITDYGSVRDAFQGADLVFHAASLVDVWYKVPEKAIYAVNVQGEWRIS